MAGHFLFIIFLSVHAHFRGKKLIYLLAMKVCESNRFFFLFLFALEAFFRRSLKGSSLKCFRLS